MDVKRVFDRLASFDEKSRNFPIRAMIRAGLPRRSYTWKCPVNLDQGSEGACTGFSTAQEAAAKPVMVKNVTNDLAREIYHRARQLDEWPGEDYEGSSVLAAVKAGAERNWYKEYRWAFGEDDLALAVGYKGPAILGIPWYEGMCKPDAAGIIAVTGKVLGGHAILCNGYNAKKSLYRLHNSWGADWGVAGDCFISAADIDRLLHEKGEACIPVVRGLGTTPA